MAVCLLSRMQKVLLVLLDKTDHKSCPLSWCIVLKQIKGDLVNSPFLFLFNSVAQPWPNTVQGDQVKASLLQSGCEIVCQSEAAAISFQIPVFSVDLGKTTSSKYSVKLVAT